MSFERRKPIVFVHNLLDGTRTVLANLRGSNSAPAWAPDGKRLAIVLTKDGTSNIYIINADGSGLTRLTNNAVDRHRAEFLARRQDTSCSPPTAAAARRSIACASMGEGEAERMTFEGSYNVTPRYSPDGKSFIFIHRNEGRFNVALAGYRLAPDADPHRRRSRPSPTFAPNGKMILYASEVKGAWYISRRFERWADQAKNYRAVRRHSRACVGTAFEQSLKGVVMRNILVAMILTYCCSRVARAQGQKSADIEQRDLFDQQTGEQQSRARRMPHKQAQIAKEQEELKRQIDEQQKRQQAAGQNDQAIVKPLPTARWADHRS